MFDLADRMPPGAKLYAWRSTRLWFIEEPEGGFWAEVPALPGCYSQGDSMSELMDNVREAISGVLTIMREQGARPESNIQILDIAV